jgi:cytochrome c-type biogenesis protein CcmH
VLLWVILAGLTAIVLIFLLRPLAGGDESTPARDSYNATVYRDQLEEIEGDLARGLIGEAEAEAAHLEVARRLLAADADAKGKGGPVTTGTWPRVALIAVALALPLAVLGLYLSFGSPRLPDQPLAARLKDPASEKSVGALVARVEARLRAHPEEGEGWDVIAPVYMNVRRYGDAADAYENAIRLLGPSAKRLSGYGQARVLEQGGLVTEEARGALERALGLDATLVEPRILLTIAKEQDGDYAAAIEDWRGLLNRDGADERWRSMVRTRIANAQTLRSGKTPAVEVPTPAPGPSAADIAAAQSMSQADRQSMVEGMVQRLATRLEQNGDDLAGWLRLVRAYTVLDQKDEAKKALARAKSQFAGDAKAIEQLDALAEQLGLTS